MKTYKPRRAIVPVESDENIRLPVIPPRSEMKPEIVKDLEAFKERNEILKKVPSVEEIKHKLKTGMVVLPSESVSNNIQQTHIRNIGGKLVLVNAEKTSVVKPALQKSSVLKQRIIPVVKSQSTVPQTIFGLPPIVKPWYQVLKRESLVPQELLYKKARKELELHDLLNELEVGAVEVKELIEYDDHSGGLHFFDEAGGAHLLAYNVTNTPMGHKFIKFLKNAVANNKRFIVGLVPATKMSLDLLRGMLGDEGIGYNAPEKVPYMLGSPDLDLPAIAYVREWGKNTEKIWYDQPGHRLAIIPQKDYILTAPTSGYGPYEKISSRGVRKFSDWQALIDASTIAAESKPMDLFGRLWEPQQKIVDFTKPMKEYVNPEELFNDARANAVAGPLESKPLKYEWIIPGRVAVELLEGSDWVTHKTQYYVFVAEYKNGIARLVMDLGFAYRDLKTARETFETIKRVYKMFDERGWDY